MEAANVPAKQAREVDQRNYEKYEKDFAAYLERKQRITKIFLPTFFVIPMALGLWIGISWYGRNLKRYLIIGLIAGAVDGAGLTMLVLFTDGLGKEDLLLLLLLGGIDFARCIFGFAAGGLLGDWIERRKYPERYGKGFAESLALMLPSEGAGRFEKLAKGFGNFISQTAPVFTLMGA